MLYLALCYTLQCPLGAFKNHKVLRTVRSADVVRVQGDKGMLTLFFVAFLLIVVTGTAALASYIARPPRKTYAVALARRLPTDPAELGCAFEAVRFTFDDGSSSPGWIIEGEKDTGPAVVVTHGFGDSRYGALTWVPLLAPYANRLIVYDLRAHGDSTARAGTAGLIEAQDLVQILYQSVMGTDGSIVLFGYSLGAGISIATATDCPDDLRQRIAAVVGDGVYRRWFEPIAGRLWSKRWPPYPFVWLVASLFALRFGGMRAFDRAKRATRLDCPLLLLHGSEDLLCPPDSARRIAESAPDGRLAVISGGGHTDLARVDPVHYADELRDVFDRIAAQPSGTGELA